MIKMKKRGVLVICMFIFLISLSLASAESIVTQTFAVDNSVCRGGNLGSPTDCTSELNNSDDIRFTIGGVSGTKQAYANGTWNLSLSPFYTLVEVIGIFEWAPDESATYTLKWYFWNSSSASYQAVGCENSIITGPSNDVTTICNLTNIYTNIESLQNIYLENEINATAAKRVLLDYFAINVSYNPDINPPTFSSYTETPSTGASYVYGQTHEFNVTITEENLDSIGIEFNEINHTDITNISDVFSFNTSNLAAGTYSYNWWANDTVGNYNASEINYYTINKATPVLTFLANEGTENLTLIYPQQVNISARADYGAVSLDKDETDYLSNNGLNIAFAAGSYIFRANITGNENYTDVGYSYYNITINKASSQTSLTFDKTSPQIYGTSINATCSVIMGAGASTLTLNGDVLSSGEPLTLAAGVWNFNCSIGESDNYSYSENFSSFIIDKWIPNGILTNTQPWSVDYGTSVTIGYSESNNGDGDVTYKVYRDSVDKGSGESATLGAGTYDYTLRTNEAQNYSQTNPLDSQVLTVNPIENILNLTSSAGWEYVYGTETGISCFAVFGTPEIFINELAVSNPVTIIFGAGSHNIKCNISESQNYTSSSLIEEINVSQSDGNVSLYLNGIEDDLAIPYPQEYNITAITLYGEVAIYFDGKDITSNNSLNITPERAEGHYNITAVSSGDENHTEASITRWLNVTLDVTAPELQIVLPQEGGTYGYDEDVLLEFIVLDTESEVDSCWYNINDGENMTIAGCQNTTFNLSGDGEYTLNLYANDSLSNEADKSVNFSVNLGAPTIILNSPMNVYLNYTNINFYYTPSDIDLDSCELWGDFDGEFKLNQTELNLLNYSENTFELILPDRNYTWNIRCNDSQGHSAFNGNKIFYVDTTAPSISITQPQGIQTSITGIPLTFSILDASPVSCSYDIEWAIGGIVKSRTEIINCSSTSFDLATEGSYILNFYVNDSAGNFNSSSSSFSVDTSAQPPINDGGVGNTGGGGGIIRIISLQLGTIPSLVINPGETKKLVLSVKNNGTVFLNDCRLKGSGEYVNWISSSSEAAGLGGGEKQDFQYTITVPEVLEKDSYTLGLEVVCEEYSKSISFVGQVIREGLVIDIINLERKSNNEVYVRYSLEELTGKNQEVEVEFVLLNTKNERLAGLNETVSLEADSSKESEAYLSIESSLEGNFNLLINAVSETSSAFVQEEVVLGSKIGGLAIIDSGTRENLLMAVIILGFGVFAFFVFRRIWKHRSFKKRIGIKEVGAYF